MKAPWNCKNSLLYASVFIVQIGSFIDGCFMSWTSPIIVKLNKLDDNPLGRSLTETEEGFLSCIGVIGVSLGSYATGYLSAKYGKKKILLIMAFPAIAGCLILTCPQNVWWLLFGRSIWGITIGANLTVAPVYVAELSDSSNRGKLCSLKVLFMNVGILLSMGAGPFTSFRVYHWILTSSFVLHFILLLIVVPESPYFLADKRLDEAENVLKKLRNNDDVKEELNGIQQYIEEKVEGSLSEILRDKGLRRGLILGCGLVFFQQFAGVSIIMSYGQKIFEDVNDFLPSAWSALIIAAMEAVFGFVAPIFIDRSGRKILLIISDIGIIITLSIFGLYFFLKKHEPSLDYLNWLPLTTMIIYKFMYTLGSAAVPWIVVGEIFPQEMKGIAVATVTAVSAWTTFVLCLSYNSVNHIIGVYGIFWSFSAIGVLALLFAIFFLFETKGKSLQEIQDIINR